MTLRILELQPWVLTPKMCSQLEEKRRSQHWHSLHILQSKATLTEAKQLLNFHVLYPRRSEVSKSLSRGPIASSQIHHKSEELNHLLGRSHGRHVELAMQELE